MVFSSKTLLSLELMSRTRAWRYEYGTVALADVSMQRPWLIGAVEGNLTVRSSPSASAPYSSSDPLSWAQRS